MVFANTPKENTHLVAIIVDRTLYNGTAKTSIDRYATQYIQSKISNSHAIVFPIDKATITAPDIAKMLTNLYHE